MKIRRADDPGSKGDGDCGELGGYSVVVQASDDQTAPEELGYSLELLSGRLPFSLPEGPVIAEGFARQPGELNFWFGDRGNAYEGTIAVSMVDRAGNVSEPMTVHVQGDAVGCGCSMRSGASPG